MLPETAVRFVCDDIRLQKVYDSAEEKCRMNLRCFGGSQVLVEGGGYEKIWLETQPMGGEMYALRNLEAAKNNCLLFMTHQRADGRLPGSIACRDGQLIPQFDKYQGFCFPYPALNMYYLLGENQEYLLTLRDTLRRFDSCLWRTRDSNGDGLLESFCIYDTGEDGALRYGDAPSWWKEDEPPRGYQVVPMASMDVTSWSYACRSALAEISRILKNGEEEIWKKKAAETAAALQAGLWNEQRGACYDRDKNGKMIDILCHNTLRCMYFGSLSPQNAGRFVREHLLDPDEFWTPFPLPSVAVSDPAFRNAPENNWSGQSEGLTWQRAILALENYGYHTLVTRLGNILIDNIARHGYHFTQQFDPFTGKPSLVHAQTHQPLPPGSAAPAQDAYGPTMLAVLEYIAHHYGIHPHLGQVWFSLGSGVRYEYEASFYHRQYRIVSNGVQAEALVDGAPIHRGSCGVRLITDDAGNILKIIPVE